MAPDNEKPRFEALPLADVPAEPVQPAQRAKEWPRTKRALCLAYDISLSTLTRWLAPFLTELEEAGYRVTQKRFTRQQVRIIFEALDPPEGYSLPKPGP